MKSILLVEMVLGLVEMTSGLVNASLSLPKWQAVKMINSFLPAEDNFFPGWKEPRLPQKSHLTI